MLKEMLKRSKTAVIANQIARNYQGAMKFALGSTEAETGSTHLTLDTHQSLAYIDEVYRDYLEYGQLTHDGLAGMRVLEIGPGDNLGVALHFLVAGASQVVCLDKFFSERDVPQQQAIYQAMRDRLDDAGRQRFDECVQLNDDVTFNEERLQYVYGVGAEEADTVFEPGSLDLVVSRAVVQDIFDPEACLSALDRLLKPGGLMLHKIDLHDYGVFPRELYHPMTFLTVSDRVYRMMTSNFAAPNRRRIGDYREIMDRLGYETALLTTNIFGVPDELRPHKADVTRGVDYSDETIALIDEIRPRLLPRYRHLPDEDLLVAGTFMVARKPG